MLIYPKPKIYSFIQYQPRTFRDVAVATFSRKSLPALGIIAVSTTALIIKDQQIQNNVQKFCSTIGVSGVGKYKIINLNTGSSRFRVYRVPLDVNSALYSLGEGVPSMLIVSGLLMHGIIKNDYRSLSTAHQLLQALVAVGITTETIKHITGRESPFLATQSGGAWRPFTSFSKYQSNVPAYDAYPSGHIATVMTTVTVLAENYPEKRWIKPVGYSLVGLVGLAMINTEAHWAGDYPLGIGIGYIFGKMTAKMNRIIKGQPWKSSRSKKY